MRNCSGYGSIPVVERRGKAERGFSLIELLVVVSIMMILTGIAIFSLARSKRAYTTDDAASKIAVAIRLAQERAVSRRQPQRIEIDRANRTMKVFNERDPSTATDDQMLTNEILSQEVVMEEGTFPKPPAPFNYNPAVYSSGVWKARFLSDGSMVDLTASKAPVTVTFYFVPRENNYNTALVRAVTVFGPTGATRLWKYDGTKFSAEVR